MVQDVSRSPVGFQLAVPSSRQLHHGHTETQTRTRTLQAVDIKKDRAAGVRVQILGREARAEIQNLIGLLTVSYLSPGDDVPSTVARVMSKV